MQPVAKTTNPTAVKKPIAADDVVEVFTFLPISVELAEYDKAIAKYIGSNVGQRQLAELAALQSNIPKTHRWEAEPSDADKNNPKELERIKRANQFYQSRLANRNPQKLAIALTPDPERMSERDRGRAGYSPEYHLIRISLPSAIDLHVFKRSATTNALVTAPMSLDETLAHEMEHALQFMRKAYANAPKMSLPCIEQKAVEVEREYTKEQNAKLPAGEKKPLRELYVDADAVLKQQLDKSAEGRFSIYNALRIIGVPHHYRTLGHDPLPPEALRPHIQLTGVNVYLDSGCHNITDDALIKRTRELLNANGLDNDSVSNNQMLQWIRQRQIEVYPHTH
jgi:hypothetical protein